MSALFKDTIKEIGKKIKIFLSILFMALLGVGFFAGIRATTPDMQNTIDSYFNDLNVFSYILELQVLHFLKLLN